MPETVNLHTLYETMGEVKEIARAAKHAANNTSAKVDSLALVVASQGELRSHVERIERSIEDQEADLAALKADKHRREGAIGLVEWISKHWPFLILCGGLVGWVGFANKVFQ